MGRTPKPWYRADRDAWYVTIDGTRHMLAKGASGRADAVREFHRIMAAGEEARASPVAGGQEVATICRLFLDHARETLAPRSVEWYLRFLKSFAEAHPGMVATDARPHHLITWAGSKGWGPTSRHGAITAVKRAFSWAAEVGHIEIDPVRGTKKPRPKRREAIPTREQVDAVLSAIRDQPFRDLITALWQTGCRPVEVFTLEASGFDPARGEWIVVNKTRHHGEPTRRIQLTGAMVEMSKRLAAAHPKGPIFVNRSGGKWDRALVSRRFARLRRKLGFGPEVTAYGLRHLYVTDALEKGVPVATVASLVGHKGSAMIDRVYSHLPERKAHLREAAEKIRGDGQKP